jgi:hypothetical protein
MEREADWELLRELAEWEPEGGVVSVYLEIDPADRGEGWRIALRDALGGVDEEIAERVMARYPKGGEHPSGRSHIGFLEVGGGREIWSDVQLSIGRVSAAQAARPQLAPLASLLDDGAPVGVVLGALERVRVLEWSLGRLAELEGWELELASLDWRERKAPSRNPAASGTGTTAAGQQQHQERLEHNRDRFLKQAGQLVAQRYGDRPWRRILVIAAGDRPHLLVKGLGQKADLVHEVPHDLISTPAAQISERVEEELEHLNREREERLVARIEEAIGTEAGAALGPEEVVRALEQGRAEEVIFDAEREFDPIDGEPANERMIILAAATSARVTPAEGLAAAALAQRDGAAAILRY